jgi:hypothetical protein
MRISGLPRFRPLGRIGRGSALLADVPIIAALVGLDVVARLMPHAPNFTPVAASALFAACVLRVRGLALIVPLAALAIADNAIGLYDWRVMVFVYGALMLPAIAGCMSERLRRPGMTVPVLLSSSLLFFAISNFAVWAFSPMYGAGFGGLVNCYVAALPFLQYTVGGDLFWGAALFGGYWLTHITNTRQLSAIVIRR